MAENSKIEWTKHTLNLWWGCTKVHQGCDHCYAETLSSRWGFSVWGNNSPRREVKSAWKDLLRYQKMAAAAEQVHTVFVGSMMDIFEKPFPMIDKDGNEKQGTDTGWLRDLLFQHISAGIYPNLIFLFLTKRPSNINKMIPDSWKIKPPTNVMFGCSPVDQETADKLIPQLLQVKGLKFLSIEPQLGEIKLDMKWLSGSTKIDWIICGGESGPGRRTFNPDWARILQTQCFLAKVPFFMKQWDKVQAIPEDLQVRQFPAFFERTINTI